MLLPFTDGLVRTTHFDVEWGGRSNTGKRDLLGRNRPGFSVDDVEKRDLLMRVSIKSLRASGLTAEQILAWEARQLLHCVRNPAR